MTQKTKVNLLGRDVEVILHSECEDNRCGLTKWKDGKFIMEFFGLVDSYTLTHECWHCMMRVLAYVDKRLHTFDELGEEIYTYVFSDFCNDVLEKVTKMKLYHKLWEEKNGQKEKDKETT